MISARFVSGVSQVLKKSVLEQKHFDDDAEDYYDEVHGDINNDYDYDVENDDENDDGNHNDNVDDDKEDYDALSYCYYHPHNGFCYY